jgi:hypothetical protein
MCYVLLVILVLYGKVWWLLAPTWAGWMAMWGLQSYADDELREARLTTSLQI